MEYKKEKVGTGRFSHLILKNSKILVDVSFDDNKDFQEVLCDPNYDTFLLYPGVTTINLGSGILKNILKKKAQFIILDGTWPCAKKMIKLTKSLHHLPRVSFHHQHLSEFKIKHQPLPGCLSTVESIYQVLVNLNQMGIEQLDGAHENLMDVFRQSVDQQIQMASDPNRQGYRKKSFSLPTDRKISKKWKNRLIFFKNGE